MAVVGIGTDLVEVERFRGVIERTPGVLDRIFLDAERRFVAARRDPTQGLAARFAAKEAVLKVLGVGLAAVPLTDVEVLGGGDGPPTLQLHGRAAERAEALGVQRWHLSLTHTDALAQATALAET
ncbi:MAG: holo-ACP synthase [Microthrixaceae bacterium]|jgi:holo-[acyl-carrier protein] synthase